MDATTPGVTRTARGAAAPAGPDGAHDRQGPLNSMGRLPTILQTRDWCIGTGHDDVRAAAVTGFARLGMPCVRGRPHYWAVPPSLSLQTASAKRGGTPSAAARLKLTKGNLGNLGGGAAPSASHRPQATPAPGVPSGLPPAAARPIPTQARAVPAAAAARAAKSLPRGAAAARQPGERKARSLVMGAVFAFVVTGGTLAAMNYQGSVAEGRSIAALQATLQVVHNEQANFRVLNQRFATWPELEAGGAKLAPTQKVLKSNASSSHWFMSVFDRETGAVCSQTGELFDEEPGERRPSCRPRDG